MQEGEGRERVPLILCPAWSSTWYFETWDGGPFSCPQRRLECVYSIVARIKGFGGGLGRWQAGQVAGQAAFLGL